MKKRLLLSVLLVEVLILTLIAFPLLRFSSKEVPLGFSHWNCAEGRYDDGWGWSPEGAQINDAFLTSPSLSLPRGDYRFSVEYEAEIDQSFRMVDENNYGLLLPEGTVHLSRSTKSATTRVRADADIPAMRICFSYNGGTYSVISVRMETDAAGLSRRFILLFVLFAALDFFLIAPRLRIPAAAVLGIALLASLPIFMDKFADGHDCVFHLMRIEALSDGLLRGIFPLRISSIHLDGWGYPTSVYYGDLLLYFPAILRIAGFSITEAYKAYVFLINFLTAAVGLFCFSRISSDVKRGALLSLLYCTAGYRLMDLYVRMAVGEYTAMLFILPVTAGLWDLLTENPHKQQLLSDALLLAIGFAGLVTSHLISTELALIACIIVCLFLPQRSLRPRTLINIIAGAVISLLLAAFFTVPLLDYLKNVPVSITSVPNPNAQRIRVEGAHIAQLFSFFQSPFGGEGYNTPSGRFALTPGPVLLALPIALMLLLSKKGNLRLAILSVFSLFFLWLSTDLFPWDRLEETCLGFLCGIQFPWRFLTVALPFLCLLLSELMKNSTCPKEVEHWILAACLLSAFVFTGQYAQEGHFIEPFDQQEILLSPDEVGGGEYMRFSPEMNRVADDEREALINSIDSRNMDWLELLSRDGLSFTLDAMSDLEESGEIRLPVFHYRGITAQDSEGHPLSVSDGENCQLVITVPAGFDGTITVGFIEPKIWQIAEIVSLLTFFGFLATIFFCVSTNKHKPD